MDRTIEKAEANECGTVLFHTICDLCFDKLK